jgi:large conductance mechanosensitive channel
MSIIKEYKKFAIKGNVLDTAVGIIIGVAFGKIISSLVADVIMPPIGVLLGGVEFTSFSIVLREATDTAAAVVISYGKFIQTVFDFIIISCALFFAIKGMNTFKQKEEVVKAEVVKAEPKASNQELLLAEIRDLLKEK